MKFREKAERLAKELENGELYDCGGSVVYGWRVASGRDPTSEAAELLLAMADEIERLTVIEDAVNELVARLRGV